MLTLSTDRKGSKLMLGRAQEIGISEATDLSLKRALQQDKAIGFGGQ